MATSTKSSSSTKSKTASNDPQFMENMMQQYQQWMQQMNQQFDTLMTCHNSFFESANKVQQQWTEQSQKNFSDNASNSKNFFDCKTLEDVVNFQSQLWKQNTENMMQLFGKQMDATFQSMNEATSNLNKNNPFNSSQSS